MLVHAETYHTQCLCSVSQTRSAPLCKVCSLLVFHLVGYRKHALSMSVMLTCWIFSEVHYTIQRLRDGNLHLKSCACSAVQKAGTYMCKQSIQAPDKYSTQVMLVNNSSYKRSDWRWRRCTAPSTLPQPAKQRLDQYRVFPKRVLKYPRLMLMSFTSSRSWSSFTVTHH